MTFHRKMFIDGDWTDACDGAVDQVLAPTTGEAFADVARGAASDVDRAVAAADDAFGRVDGALISVGGPPKGPVTDISDDQWSAAFESVFLGAVRLAREVGAALPAGGSLGLVLSSSVRAPV